MKSNTVLKLIAVLVLLAGAVAGFAVLRGAIADKMLVVATQRAREDRTLGLDFGNTLRSNLQDLTRKEGVIKGVFIDGAHLVEFIEAIEGFGAQHNLDIVMDSVAQGESRVLAASPGKLVPVTFTIHAEGTYSDISSFVKGLGSFEQRLDIEQIGLFSSGDGTYTLRLSVKGIMLSYE
jgi:hypothetical protein